MYPKCTICSAFGLGIVIILIILHSWSGSIKETIPQQLLRWKIAENFSAIQTMMRFTCNTTLEENSNTSMEYDNALKLYTMQKRPIIWVYWNDFGRMPPYIKLSIDTVKCHNYPNFHVELLNASTVEFFLKNLHAAFQYMLENHKSDYIRGRLLYEYGGMWIDADTIQLSSLAQLFEMLQEYDVIGYDWPSGEIFGSTIIGPIRARHPLLQIWLKKTNEILTSNLAQLTDFASGKSGTNYPLRWSEIMSDLLNPAMRRLLNERKTYFYRLDGYEYYGGLFRLGLFGQLFRGPIQATQLDRIDLLFQDSIPLLIYHNRNVGDEWKKMNLEEFLRKDTLFRHIWNRSMTTCRKRSEIRAKENCWT